MAVKRFHRSWSWSIKLVQFHTGDVWPGIKMIQTEYRLVSVGVSVGPAYFSFKNNQRKWSPIWNWWPLFIWTWIVGIGFGWSPIGYAGFVSCPKVQGNFLLLCSSTNFVGYSYDWYGVYDATSHHITLKSVLTEGHAWGAPNKTQH